MKVVLRDRPTVYCRRGGRPLQCKEGVYKLERDQKERSPAPKGAFICFYLRSGTGGTGVGAYCNTPLQDIKRNVNRITQDIILNYDWHD